MPLFDFECAACRHAFEALVRGDGRPDCPQCGEAQAQKRLSVCARPGRGKKSYGEHVGSSIGNQAAAAFVRGKTGSCC